MNNATVRCRCIGRKSLGGAACWLWSRQGSLFDPTNANRWDREPRSAGSVILIYGVFHRGVSESGQVRAANYFAMPAQKHLRTTL
jgi:hypothetical protein